VSGLLVGWLGLAGGLAAMAPVGVATIVLGRLAPGLADLKPATETDAGAQREDDRRAMGLLSAVIALRSVAWFTLLAFVPLWAIAHGHSKASGNRLLFLMLLAGAVGTLIVGPVADRVGLRRTLTATQAAVGPLMLVFVYRGVAGAIALMLIGVCVVGTFGVTMV